MKNRYITALTITLSVLVMIFGSVYAQKPAGKAPAKATKIAAAKQDPDVKLRRVKAGSASQDLSAGGNYLKVAPRIISRTPVHPELFKPQTGKAVRFGITPPLRDIEPIRAALKSPSQAKVENETEEVENLEFPWSNLGMDLPATPDAAVLGPDKTPKMNVLSPPTVSFEALNSQHTVDVTGGVVIPPDTNGDVGPNHIVETVNSPIQIYNKTGVPLIPPTQMSSLWETIGGVCADTDKGDPVVLYDPMADRWLISQFAFDILGTVAFPPPTHQCVAISVTGDPTGAWYAYDFIMPGTKFHDYPHYGMWPDGYYMTSNLFNAAGNLFQGTAAVAYDRTGMLAGDPDASFIYFDLEDFDPNIGGALPADMDGLTPPPIGSPEVFAYYIADEFGDPFDGLRLFNFHADFDNPENSTFTERAESPVVTPAFNPLNPAGRADIPQPAPAVAAANLDSIQDRILHRLQYRNFGSFDALTVAQTVDVDPTAAYQAGARYTEMHSASSGGAYSTYDAGSIALTSEHRWMGSAALDRAGNLAVGYSVSSSSTFPSIRYFGRRADKTIEGETTLITGSGSQTAGNPGSPAGNRWGDYSNMAVDPVDDCSFWYFQQYYASTDTTPADYPFGRNWQTRVGKFRFPTQSCASAGVGTLSGTITDSQTLGAIFRARVLAVDSLGNSFEVGSAADGTFSRVLPPGNYALTGTAPGYSDVGPIYVTLTSGGTVIQNFALPSVPSLEFSGYTVDDSAVPGNNNGYIDPNECINLTVDMENTGPGSSDATGMEATLVSHTAGVTVSPNSATQTYPDLAGGNSGGNGLPYSISISPAFVCGTPIQMSLHVVSDQGTFDVPVTLKSGTPNIHTFSVSVATPIPDGGGAGNPINVSIPVAGITDVVTKVSLSVVINTTQNNDIDMFLLNPVSTSVEISTDNGSRGDNYGTDCPADDNDAVFDMAAKTSILSTLSPVRGHFRPEGNLNTFNGVNPNGTWTLRISDDTVTGATPGEPTGNGLATFQCATLIIETQPTCTPGSGVCAEAEPVLDLASTTVSGGNGDDNIDVHECFDLNVGVINNGTADSTGTPISAVLTTSTPGVTIHQPNSDYSSTIIPGGVDNNLTAFQIETSPSLTCGSDISFQLDVDTDQGHTIIPFTMPVGAATTTLFFNSTPTPVPDPGSVDDPITVGGFNGAISNVTVAMRMTHTFDSDMVLQVVHPDGTVVNLSSRNGGSGDNYGNACPGNSVFSDSGTTYVFQNTAPFVGTFKPEEALAAFHGKPANGTWNLRASDLGGGDVGNILCWNLAITTTECQDGNCCPTITLTPATLPDAFGGLPYSQTVTASGGAGPYTYSVSSGSLPSGLSLDSSTGEISGTPDTPGGPVAFDITATDANGCTGTASLSITVQACPTITITPATLSDGNEGQAYSVTLAGNGGVAPYTFALSSGSLPSGLSLNSSTGEISGTPDTPGASSFDITATDANGCTGTASLSITVQACPAITITPATLSDGTTGTAYNATLAGNGGAAPYTFAVTAGSLPAGLSLNGATGDITGTPTTVESQNFTITATDANGCTGSQAYALNIVEACLFCDDFETGGLATDWTYSGSWSESGGSLQTTASGKASAIASPAYGGCQICSVESSVSVTGGAGNKVWLMGWYQDKNNNVQLLLKEENNKIILKQQVGGTTVKKQSASVTIDPNTTYVVQMGFNGTQFDVSVDATHLITMVPAAPVPTGTFGYQVKSTTASFGYIDVQ